MGRARYNNYSSLSFIEGLTHIQTGAYRDGNNIVISFNTNADLNMALNLQKAFGGPSIATIYRQKSNPNVFEISVPSSAYAQVTSKHGNGLETFFNRFLEAQTISMKQTLSSITGFKDFVLSDNKNSIICERSKKMSSLDFYRTELAFNFYRDRFMSGNTRTKTQLTNMSYGPSFLRDYEKTLAKELSKRRPNSTEMFRSGILGIKPTDILFFNQKRFEDNFPGIKKDFKQKTPEKLISQKLFKPKNPFKENLFLLPINIVEFAIMTLFYVITYYPNLFLNRGYNKLSKEFRDQVVSRKTLDQKGLNKSVILSEMTAALNDDLRPFENSPLNGKFLFTIKDTHSRFAQRTLIGHYKDTYDLKSPSLKTKMNSSSAPKFCGGTTEFLNGSDSSIITFYGHSRLEAKETILHELIHSVCHRIERSDNYRQDKSEFNRLLHESNQWIKDFCRKHNIKFDTSTIKDIDGRILQDLDYHANDGIEYMANLLPKISQIRSLKPDEFDKEVGNKTNPIKQLCNKFDEACEKLNNKDASKSYRR
jgi:hypothetical protein